MNRRDFLRGGAWVAGALASAGLMGCRGSREGTAGAPSAVADGSPPASRTPSATTPGPDSGVSAARVGNNRVFESPPAGVQAAIAANQPPADMVKAAMQVYGGVDAVFRKGDVVVIKPNLAWARDPASGANTSPEVLKAVIQLAQGAGAAQVLVVEHTCDSSQVSFDLSGGKAVCEALGVKLISLDSESLYEEKPIPGGVNIKSDAIARDILECDVYINLPCLKHHGATNVSLALKNQMGANFDRGRYHREGQGQGPNGNLHQNIADLATALRPTLVILDATRALTDNGPKGPGNVKPTHTIVVSHDMVLADALGAQMLDYSVDQVPHIRLAGDAGVGTYDISAAKIKRV